MKQVDQYLPMVCPVCGSMKRDRLSWEFLERKTDFFDGGPKSMLHFAPEESLSRRFRKVRGLDYMTADIEPGKAMKTLDITDITFPDGSFDIVYCSHVLEHIPNDHMALSELNRVLKPGGWAVIIVPINSFTDKTYEDPSITTPEEREKAYGISDHVRRYGIDVVDRIQMAGFQVEKISGHDFLDQFSIQHLGIDEAEPLFFCRKASYR